MGWSQTQTYVFPPSPPARAACEVLINDISTRLLVRSSGHSPRTGSLPSHLWLQAGTEAEPCHSHRKFQGQTHRASWEHSEPSHACGFPCLHACATQGSLVCDLRVLERGPTCPALGHAASDGLGHQHLHHVLSDLSSWPSSMQGWSVAPLFTQSKPEGPGHTSSSRNPRLSTVSMLVCQLRCSHHPTPSSVPITQAPASWFYFLPPSLPGVGCPL